MERESEITNPYSGAIARLDAEPEPASLGDDPARTLEEEAQRFGLKKTSGKRSREEQEKLVRQGRTTARNSYHLYEGNSGALDFSGDPEKMEEFTQHLRDTYGGQLPELFHGDLAWKNGRRIPAVPHHEDHTHVAWGQIKNPYEKALGRLGGLSTSSSAPTGAVSSETGQKTSTLSTDTPNGPQSPATGFLGVPGVYAEGHAPPGTPQTASGTPATPSTPQPDLIRRDSKGNPLTHDGYPAIKSPDGKIITERSITVTDPRLNGGKPTNIPSVWKGKQLDQATAIEQAIKSGRQWQAFGSVNEAVKAAKERSAVKDAQDAAKAAKDEAVAKGTGLQGDNPYAAALARLNGATAPKPGESTGIPGAEAPKPQGNAKELAAQFEAAKKEGDLAKARQIGQQLKAMGWEYGETAPEKQTTAPGKEGLYAPEGMVINEHGQYAPAVRPGWPWIKPPSEGKTQPASARARLQPRDVTPQEDEQRRAFEADKKAGNLMAARQRGHQMAEHFGWEYGEQDGWPYIKPPAHVNPYQTAAGGKSVAAGDVSLPGKAKPGAKGEPPPLSVLQRAGRVAESFAENFGVTIPHSWADAGKEAKSLLREHTPVGQVIQAVEGFSKGDLQGIREGMEHSLFALAPGTGEVSGILKRHGQELKAGYDEWVKEGAPDVPSYQVTKHILAGAIPIFGPPAKRALDQLEKGDYEGAAGSGLALIALAFGPKVLKAARGVEFEGAAAREGAALSEELGAHRVNLLGDEAGGFEPTPAETAGKGLGPGAATAEDALPTEQKGLGPSAGPTRYLDETGFWDDAGIKQEKSLGPSAGPVRDLEDIPKPPPSIEPPAEGQATHTVQMVDAATGQIVTREVSTSVAPGDAYWGSILARAQQLEKTEGQGLLKAVVESARRQGLPGERVPGETVRQSMAGLADRIKDLYQRAADRLGVKAQQLSPADLARAATEVLRSPKGGDQRERPQRPSRDVRSKTTPRVEEEKAPVARGTQGTESAEAKTQQVAAQSKYKNVWTAVDSLPIKKGAGYVVVRGKRLEIAGSKWDRMQPAFKGGTDEIGLADGSSVSTDLIDQVTDQNGNVIWSKAGPSAPSVSPKPAATQTPKQAAAVLTPPGIATTALVPATADASGQGVFIPTDVSGLKPAGVKNGMVLLKSPDGKTAIYVRPRDLSNEQQIALGLRGAEVTQATQGQAEALTKPTQRGGESVERKADEGASEAQASRTQRGGETVEGQGDSGTADQGQRQIRVGIAPGAVVSHADFASGKPLRVESIEGNTINVTRLDTGKQIRIKADSRIGRELKPITEGAIVSETPARVTGTAGIVSRERTERRKAQAEAATDKLTGLQSQSQWLAAKPRIEAEPSLHIGRLDVNGLKATNDRFGHEAGDRLISDTAKIIAEEAANAGIPARLVFRSGRGDEFSIAAKRSDVEKAVKAIQERVSREVTLPDGTKASIAAGIGGREKVADIRMYQQKKAQRKAEERQRVVDKLKAKRTGQAKTVEPQDEVTAFRTAKGSVYQVHPDQTTTRDKAQRPEHKDFGPQARSAKTYYVTPEQAIALGEVQTQGVKKELAETRDGRLGMRYLEGKDRRKFESRTVVEPQSEPKAGLIPVELWEGHTPHFGNAITEVGSKARPLTAKQPEEAVTQEPQPITKKEVDAWKSANPEAVKTATQIVKRLGATNPATRVNQIVSDLLAKDPAAKPPSEPELLRLATATFQEPPGTKSASYKPASGIISPDQLAALEASLDSMSEAERIAAAKRLEEQDELMAREGERIAKNCAETGGRFSIRNP